MSPKINFHVLPKDKKITKDFVIHYNVAKTLFGSRLIGTNRHRICHLSFHVGEADVTAIERDFPGATLKRDDDATVDILDEAGELDVLLTGTDLQVKVWRSLVDIKEGTTACYEDVARAVGYPKAVRAVSTAIAKNKVAFLVPCHRVIRKSGDINKYRWGVERKRLMLDYESKLLH